MYTTLCPCKLTLYTVTADIFMVALVTEWKSTSMVT